MCVLFSEVLSLIFCCCPFSFLPAYHKLIDSLSKQVTVLHSVTEKQVCICVYVRIYTVCIMCVYMYVYLCDCCTYCVHTNFRGT